MGKKSRRQRARKNQEESTQPVVPPAEQIAVVTPREKADRAREDFIRLSKDKTFYWDSQRKNLLNQYDKALRQLVNAKELVRLDDLSANDKQFIKSLWRNESELATIRAFALGMWAMWHIADFQMEEAFHASRLAIKVIVEAEELEKRKFEAGLKDMALYHSIKAEALTEAKFDIRCIHGIYTVGGQKCDVCGTTAEQMGMNVLQCCARCQFTFYCSPCCQKQDWKKRHKDECRKKGEFEEGDVAFYIVRNGIFDVGTPVIIVATAFSDRERHHWKIAGRAASGYCTTVVPSNQLRRIRPSLWSEWKQCIYSSSTSHY